MHCATHCAHGAFTPPASTCARLSHWPSTTSCSRWTIAVSGARVLMRPVVLPHIGSATIESRTQMAVLTAQNIIAALDAQKMPAEIL